MFGHLKEVLSFTKGAKKNIRRISVFIIVLSLLDLVGVSLVYPFIDIIINEEGSMAFAKTKEYLPSFNAFLLLAVSVFIIVFILRTIAAIVLQDRIIKFSMSTQVELRETLLNKLAMISIDEYKKSSTIIHIDHFYID